MGEHGIPVPHPAFVREIDVTPVFDRGYKNPAPGSKHDFVTFWVRFYVGDVLRGVVLPFLAQLVQVGGQADINSGIRIRGAVVEPEVGTPLVDDPAPGTARIPDVKILVFRMLPEVLPEFIHGPEVHGAVPVRDKIDTALVPHRVVAFPGVIGRQPHGFGVAVRKFPDLPGRTPLVPLGHVPVIGGPDEEKGLPGSIIGSLARLLQGQHLF